VYDRAAMGVLATNVAGPLQVYVDQWGPLTAEPLPAGPDNRSTANMQEQDFRSGSGTGWQIDWQTWAESLRLDSQHGLYSEASRLQSGRNIDRMVNLSNGWAEIEMDWSAGTPFVNPKGFFAPMIAFHKEINREENLEVTFDGLGDGRVNLLLEAWTGDGGKPQGTWAMPAASAGGGQHYPEPGDILRIRWQQNSPNIRVWVSYYDASASHWYANVLDKTFNVATNSALLDSDGKVTNFLDGNHRAASITIDSTAYSIRRFKLGAFATYPGP
jgi:hypothetical protein